MVRHFIKRLEKKYTDSKTRNEKGTVISGGVAISVNVFLFIFKGVIGIFTGAVSVITDAFNNLSDAASGIIAVIGEKISKKPVDDEHPFGHGRMEYISAMLISFFVLIVGFELAKNSIEKIISPTEVKFSTLSLILLIITVLIKLYLAFFDNEMFKFTKNINLKAVMIDSLTDCLTTTGAIVAFIISSKTSFNRADGIIGIIIAVIIFIEGIKLMLEIISDLLGKAPDKETVDRIKDIIINTKGIYGVHDIMIHTYGPNSKFASAHAEIPVDSDVVSVHNAIDKAERDIKKELNITICIHADPTETDNDIVKESKALAEEVIHEYDSDFSLHDFRLSTKGGYTKYIFDLVIPYNYKKDKNTITKELKEKFHQKDENINLSITIEHSFV